MYAADNHFACRKHKSQTCIESNYLSGTVNIGVLRFPSGSMLVLLMCEQKAVCPLSHLDIQKHGITNSQIMFEMLEGRGRATVDSISRSPDQAVDLRSSGTSLSSQKVVFNKSARARGQVLDFRFGRNVAWQELCQAKSDQSRYFFCPLCATAAMHMIHHI